MKKSYMSDDWIINVSRFAGYDRIQCPQNLQAQQLICVLYYTISSGKKYTVFTWKIDLTCVICWWHLASHNKTQEWGEAAHFRLSSLEGKIIWHLKKKQYFASRVSSSSLYEMYTSILKTFLVAATLVYGHVRSPFHSDLDPFRLDSGRYRNSVNHPILPKP